MKKEDKKKDGKKEFEITELYMAKAGFHRCFYGTIKQYTDDDGKNWEYSEIKVKDAKICSRSQVRDILGEQLDDMVLMILDHGLHENPGASSKIFGGRFYHN